MSLQVVREEYCRILIFALTNSALKTAIMPKINELKIKDQRQRSRCANQRTKFKLIDTKYINLKKIIDKNLISCTKMLI